jgi:hypothetical protein
MSLHHGRRAAAWCVAGLLIWVIVGAPVRAAEKTSAEPKSAREVAEAYPALPVPHIGVRQEDLHPQYSELFTFVWVHVPEIPGCVLDLLTYEWSNLEYLGVREVGGGTLELRHRSRESPSVLLVSTVTPQPGAVEIVARAEVDKERDPQGKLPDKLPEPNLCFRVKRAEGCFSSYPYAFPEFISRSFIFTEKGRTFLTDTVRLKNVGEPADDPRNNPPWIQVYDAAWVKAPNGPAAKTWYNSSPDRFIAPVIGVVSRDRKYLTAIANDCPERNRMAQAWQECFHNNPVWLPKDAPPAERRWRLKIYIMPNDPEALLKRVGEDFPNALKLNEKQVP